MFSIDTETTGIDIYHGARPYFVTICEEDQEPIFWDWDVNPINRQPEVVLADLDEIQSWLLKKQRRVLQNTKFDYEALYELYKYHERKLIWSWLQNDDTLLAGHLINTAQPHDLTSMVLIYLGVNVKPFDDRLKTACQEARRMAKSKWPEWRLAKEGLPEMPSAKGGNEKKESRGAEKASPWKYDAWLPKRIAQELNYADDHPWWRVLQEYACVDSQTTVALFKVQLEIIKERGLLEIYQERLKILPIVSSMEQQGIVLSKERATKLQLDFEQDANKAHEDCLAIAKQKNFDLVMPKSGVNNSVREFIEEYLNLPWPGDELGNIVAQQITNHNPQISFDYGSGNSASVMGKKKAGGKKQLGVTAKGGRAYDKNVKEHWLATLPDGEGKDFVAHWLKKSKRDTQLSYLKGYGRFWIPLGITNKRGEQCWFRMHPSLNPTGTGTLRWSSSNPNEQNISKQDIQDCKICEGDGCDKCKGTGKETGSNLRFAFGPAPGREWWSCDAKNIELRLPAYEVGEEAMIDLFERPNDPPYFGSYHMLIFDTLHPEKFAKHGMACKDIYGDTWYQWTKNGNFAVGYGSVEQSGTADRAYHMPGAFGKVKKLFRAIHGPGGLNQQMIEHANAFGFVETIPDRSVSPNKGYPIYCTRSQWGSISPTIPLNYHVQSSAMWWMMKAMIRCQEYLNELNSQPGSKGYYIVLQVHDELVFDFPKGSSHKTNLPIIRKIKQLMEMGGSVDYDIPTPVSAKYHPDNWAVGIVV